jgi:hypothetical protein
MLPYKCYRRLKPIQYNTKRSIQLNCGCNEKRIFGTENIDIENPLLIQSLQLYRNPDIT